MKFVFAVLMCFLASVNGEANVNSERKLLSRRSLTKAESNLILSDYLRGTMDDLEAMDEQKLRERRLHWRWKWHKHKPPIPPTPQPTTATCGSNQIKKNGQCKTCGWRYIKKDATSCRRCGSKQIKRGNICKTCTGHYDSVRGNNCYHDPYRRLDDTDRQLSDDEQQQVEAF